MGRRWVIDAMNVIGSKPDKWWNDPDRAVRAFVEAIANYAASSGQNVTVVLDKDPGRLPSPGPATLVVASRRGRNAADHEIVELVRRDDSPSEIAVVTSDKRLRERVEELGARVFSSRRFRERLDALLNDD